MKKRLAIYIGLAVALMLTTMAAGPLVRENDVNDLYDIMDKETTVLFEELSEPGQKLFLRLWESIKKEAPKCGWEGLVHKIVRQYHVSEYGEDGKGVGEDPVLLRSCTFYTGTVVSCGYSASHTGSSCTMGWLSSFIDMQACGGGDFDMCTNCSLVYSYRNEPTECGSCGAFGRHEWGDDPSGGRSTYDFCSACCCK